MYSAVLAEAYAVTVLRASWFVMNHIFSYQAAVLGSFAYILPCVLYATLKD